MINIELFSCAGGMAEGFRRAGIHFDMAVDFESDHCDSYEHNLGYRPIRMDVRDLLRMVKLGWRTEIGLFVADPPCTPWSRAGKRLGTSDERDMLVDTCELIATLRPKRYLIGNVPGLNDATHWHIVQEYIGGLARLGYCVLDFAALDAADYGTPQNRVRPFWFGHLKGPCIRWPLPTHASPKQRSTISMFATEERKPWVTCRDALSHLSGDDLGRPVKLRWKDGISGPNHRPSRLDEPAGTITRNTHSDGCLLVNGKHPNPVLDEPSPSVTTRQRQGQILAERRVGTSQGMRPRSSDGPSPTIVSSARGQSILEWPWSRPSTTVTSRPGLAPPGHHDESFAVMSLPDAIVLSERAATILQGFPEDWRFSGETKKARWSQIGQAMPPPLAHAVATSVREQGEAEDFG